MLKTEDLFEPSVCALASADKASFCKSKNLFDCVEDTDMDGFESGAECDDENQRLSVCD